jgi:hypothetical protein
MNVRIFHTSRNQIINKNQITKGQYFKMIYRIVWPEVNGSHIIINQLNKQTKAYKKYYKQNKVLKHMQIFIFIVNTTKELQFREGI